MKQLKQIALILSIALSTHLKAEVINQAFDPDFAPEYPNETPGETGGWTYASLGRLTLAEKVYYGSAAAYMRTFSWQDNAFLMTPEKAGGTGWLTFLYKTSDASSWDTGNCELEVKISEDGVTFTVIDTVRTSIREDKNWFRYSKLINSAGAKYVKFELLKNVGFTSNMAIDEIGITDAPGTSLELAFLKPIEGEVGQTNEIPDALSVMATSLSGDISLSLDQGENSPFALSRYIVSETLPANISVSFAPTVKNVSSDFIKVSGNNLPALTFKISGLGLERTVVEGFNPASNSHTYGNSDSFDYLSWSVVNGSFVLGSSYNSDYIYEDEGAVRFSGSLTSPKKAGGIGSFSFFYRADKIQENINFIVSSSSDGIEWTEIDRLTASSPYFSQYIKQLNSDAGYIKVEFETPSTDSGSPLLLIDAFSITEKNIFLPSVSGNEVKYLAESNAPYSFSIPLTSVGLTGNLTGSTDNAQLQAGEITANSITISYLPEEGKSFAAGLLSISGGGLNFPVKIPVSAYLASETLFTGFDDGNWQGSSSLYYYFTGDGWTVINGQRNTYNAGFNSAAAVSVNSAGSLISPPKSGGIGSIQFYARGGSSSSSSDFSVYVSEDGINWGDAIGNVAGVPTGAYQEYSYTVNRANAKYVKVKVSGYDCLFENFTVTKNGVDISKLSFLNVPEFLTPPGETQTLPLNIEGSNITSGLTVSFKQGAVFSSAVSTIPAAEINNQIYGLPVSFRSESGVYFTDTLVISGDCLAFDYTFPLKGYILQNLLFEDFDKLWTELSYGNYITANGWTIANGSRETYDTGFGSVAAVSLQGYSGGQMISPPKSGGIGTLQFFAKVGYGTAVLAVSISENGSDWTALENVISINASSYTEYLVPVNNPDAKYIKIAVSESSCNLENVTVTKNGVGISRISLENQPAFKTGKGVLQTENLLLSGENITSGLTVSFRQGKAFSSAVSTVAAADINGKTFELPVNFQSETGTYLLDTLVISGNDLAYDCLFPLKGYVLQDLIYQDFNGNWIQGDTYEFHNVDGWEITYGTKDTYNNIYEGSAAVSLSRSTSGSNPSFPASIFSLPKSGGVGIVSFYYKTGYTAASLRVLSYKSLADAPVEVETIDIPGETPYTEYRKTVNDADAQYIEIQLLPSTDSFSSIYIDAVTVTANGKDIPSATVPAFLRLSAYEEETDARTFDLQFENVGEEIHLSLANGTDFSIDKTGIAPGANSITEALAVAYIPSGFFSEDRLFIESAGLLKPLSIPVYGNILKDSLFQDFNAPGWLPSEGTWDGVLDGWVISQGKRTNPYEMIEGDPGTGGSLRLAANMSGNLVSPAKSGGIHTVEFYYRSQFNYYTSSVLLLTATSADGQNWTGIDTLELTLSEFQPAKYLYSREINDREARYFRIGAKLPEGASNAEGFLYIDSVAIDALPYLRRVGKAPEVETGDLPYNIPVQVAGLLNSAATISLEASDDAAYFSLPETEISPEEVSGGAVATFDVVFNGEAVVTGDYQVRVNISGADIETVRIPLFVRYQATGMESISGPVSVYLSRDGVLNILGAQAGTKVTVINLQGQAIFNTQTNSASEHFDLPLQTGVYLVKAGGKVWKIKKN
jgi:hypothetical protein